MLDENKVTAQTTTEEPTAEISASTSESLIVDNTDTSISPAQQKALSELLSEDLRKEASLSSFKDINDLAKSYVSAQRMLGSSIRIPGPDASDEVKQAFLAKVTAVDGIVKIPDGSNQDEVNAFFNKLGRPENPEGYQIQLPEGLDPQSIEPNIQAEFKQLAHKLGLTPGQANSLAQFELGKTLQQIQEKERKYEQGKEQLRALWGQDFDNRAQGAKQMIEVLKSKYPEATEDLMSSHITNPLVYVMLAELNQVYKENGKLEGKGAVNYGLTPEEARARINELRNNASDPIYDASHPQHGERLEHMRKLYSQAFPDERQS